MSFISQGRKSYYNPCYQHDNNENNAESYIEKNIKTHEEEKNKRYYSYNGDKT